MDISRKYLAIVDLEATCSDDGAVPRNRMEVIEIGAVMLEPFERSIAGEFQIFVRPILYPILTPFCKNLTSITQRDVDTAEVFPQSLAKFRDWLKDFKNDCVFSSWGDYDKNQLRLECERHSVKYPFSHSHINLKKVFQSWFISKFGIRKKQGLQGALYRLGISPDYDILHRGVSDARNIARVIMNSVYR